MTAMTAAGTIDKAAAAKLPPVPGGGTTQLQTNAQQAAAGTVLTQQWPSVTG
jgi:hypothetical protein